MTRCFGAALVAVTLATPVLAQGADPAPKGLAEGRQRFEQSCGVCHTRPLITSGRYGPALSRESASGNVEAMRDVIANGTPRMPGFKHLLSPAQISNVVAYMQTLDPPPPDPKPTARTSGERRDDN